MIEIRDYRADDDRDAVHRTFKDCGWMEGDKAAERTDLWLKTGARVATVDGEPESAAVTKAGRMGYLGVDLALSGVAAVVTSRRARRQGLASRVTARAIAEDAEAGAVVSVLGVFDQGFYDLLGYGTGTYERWTSIDPATLIPDPPKRMPVRLGFEDFEQVHAGRLARRRLHGGCVFHEQAVTHGHMLHASHPVGLGYRDEAGALTHHLWLDPKGEHGPDRLVWMAWRTPAQLFELLGLLKGMSDQVAAVRMADPAGVQLQDLLRRPFRSWLVRRKGDLDEDTMSMAWWQVRICDLPRAIGAMRLPGEPLRFGLELEDPIVSALGDREGWRGVGGRWTVQLGPESSAVEGLEPGLPVLRATVNAFSRLWLGVMPASSLAITDRFEGPEGLIEAIDRLVRLPRPELDWPI